MSKMSKKNKARKERASEIGALILQTWCKDEPAAVIMGCAFAAALAMQSLSMDAPRKHYDAMMAEAYDAVHEARARQALKDDDATIS